MDISKMPIWFAYVLAPALLLLFTGKVILRSESPLVLVAFAVVSGLLSAAVLHAYVFIKRKPTKGDGP